jgi:hypothetical protein
MGCVLPTVQQQKKAKKTKNYSENKLKTELLPLSDRKYTYIGKKSFDLS